MSWGSNCQELKRPRLWIGALWLGWLICFVLLVSLWSITLSTRTLSILNARQLAMAANLEALRESFVTLQRLPGAVVGSLEQELRSGPASVDRLQQLRADAAPLCRLYWADSAGRPKLSGDTEQPHPWMLRLVESRLKSVQNLTILRPTPPGMEAGRTAMTAHPDTPESYFLVALRRPGGDILIGEMALEVVFDAWLLRPLTRSGLSGDVSTKVLSHHTPWQAELKPPETVDLSRWLWPWEVLDHGTVWRWQVDTFFSADAHPFHKLEVQLDNRAALRDNLEWHLWLLFAGTLLMATFGLSLWATARAVRRETELAEARSRFSAMVSHELRTPITAIDMYLEILRDGLIDEPDKLAEYHQILSRESRRLKGLVENLLAVGSLEHGKQLTKQEFDLNEMLSEVVSAYSDHQITLELGAQPELFGNREALAGVFSNLIQNALKYGKEPVSVRTISAGTKTVIEVEDQGPGIALEERTKIFAPYYQVGQPDSSKQPGVGLGLALAKGLIEQHGGDIEVRQAPAGGALFVLTLPRGEQP